MTEEKSSDVINNEIIVNNEILTEESINITTNNEGEVVDNEEVTVEPKKRKSRWTNELNNNENSNTTNDTTKVIEEVIKPKIRKSRFTSAAPVVVDPYELPQEIQQEVIALKIQLQSTSDRLVTVLQDSIIIDADPNRPASPPPKYDGNGKRTNTREVRMREAIMAERTTAIEKMLKLNPLFIPPSDYVRTKPFKKVFVPVKEFPTYNFIGLIIGPRGNTQKKMENATSSRISIRGKGSLKEGSRGGRVKGVDDDEELHVHITAETWDNVEAACAMVSDLLKPINDDENSHKQNQLKELALINGTLRDDDYCTVCGEKGHRQFECPLKAKTFKAIGIKCTICGDLSHPTRDCPLKDSAPQDAIQQDSEYDSFMSALGSSGSSLLSHSTSSNSLDINSNNDNKDDEVNNLVASQSRLNQTIIHASVMTGLAPPTLCYGTSPKIPAPVYTTTTNTGLNNPSQVPWSAPNSYPSQPVPLYPVNPIPTSFNQWNTPPLPAAPPPPPPS
jgi:splicing factor 1